VGKLERDYQAGLIDRISMRFPGCFILKNDEQYIQGIPDLTILYGTYWVMLEVKKSAKEPYRPNQEYYLEVLGEMSYTATIFPENEAEVLDEVQSAFGIER
jgi:hypothetical protein